MKSANQCDGLLMIACPDLTMVVCMLSLGGDDPPRETKRFHTESVDKYQRVGEDNNVVEKGM